MRVFGLTGGIGSGKSTVGRHFRARGLPVLDADELSRELVLPGSAALAEIAAAFGPAFVDPVGALDRVALGRRVFADASERARLEAILHPRVRALASARFAALESAGEPLACYEVPLLFEVGLDASLRPVVVVSAPEALQVERAARRDGVPAETVRARVAAQLPLAEKVRRADHVIDNSGAPERALADADRVLEAICRELGIDPRRYLPV